MILDDADGLPVEGVRVEVWTEAVPGELVRWSASDPLGFATVRDVAPGGYRVRWVHPGYAAREVPIRLAEGEVMRGDVRLVRVPGPPRFDVYVEVVCVTAGIPLANVPVVLERYEAAGAAAPAEVRTERTDALGATAFRGMAGGHVRFRVNAGGDPGWMVYSNTVLQSVDRTHQATIYLKPVPRTLDVRVEGFDAVRRAVGGLTNVVVELTGLAPSALATNGQLTVVPTRTGVTERDGVARFSHLPSIPWRVRTKRLGYAPREQVILPGELDGVVTVPIEAELRTLAVTLTSHYTNQAVYVGVPVRLEGLTNSNTEGIERILTNGTPASRRVFADLLPGRYRLSAEGSPEVNDIVRAAPLFQGADTVELFGTGTTEIALPLSVAPARVWGRLLAAEATGATVPEGDPTSALSSRRPAYGPKAAVGIEFLEYLENPLLARTNRTFVTNTDAGGFFSIAVPPGRYGVRILSLSNYWGSHVLRRTLSGASTNVPSEPGVAQGWPFHQLWRHAGRPPKNGTPNDGEALVLESGEVSLDLFVRRQVISVGGTLGGPSLDLVLGYSADDGLLQNRSFSAIALGQGTATLVNEDTLESRTVPFLDDGANVTDLYLFPDVVPGNYQLSFAHPWLRMPFEAPASFGFRVFDWRAPGELPVLDPSLPANPSPMGFKPLALLSSATRPSGTVVPQFEVYQWVEENEQGNPPAYELQPGVRPTIEYVQPDFAGGLIFRNLNTVPAGPYTFWARISSGYVGRDNGLGGVQVHQIYLGGPNENVGAEPPETTYSLTYRAISNEDPSLLIPGIELGLAPDEFSPAEEIRITASTNRTAAGITGPMNLVSARDLAGRWRPLERYETNRIGSVILSIRTNLVYDLTLVDPATRRLALTVRMRAASSYEGTVTGPSSHERTTAQVYDRYGTPIGMAPLGPTGLIDIGTALGALSNVTQTLYLDVHAPGYKPVRRRVPSSPASGTQPVPVELEAVPPPTILGATLDRYGLFVPGVKRTGVPTNFLTATGPLTMTWRVRVQTSEVTLPSTGFDAAAGSAPGGSTTAPDRIDAVYLINPGRSTGDVLGTVPVPIDIPDGTDPITVRRWVDQAERGALGRVFVTRASSILPVGTAGEMQAEGKIPLWMLPPGDFLPVVVVLTQYGAVAVRRGFDLPSPGHQLRGVPTPRWLATAQDLFGITAGIQPTAEKLAGYFMGERFKPLPRFTARIEPHAEPGYVAYSYQLGIRWKEGQESQEQGYLNFAPDPLGLEIEADFDFGYNAREVNQYYAEARANGVLTGLDLQDYLPKAARNWVTDGPSGQLVVNARTLNQRNLDAQGAPWEAQFDDEYRGQLDFEAEVNLVPFTGRLPNIGPLLRVLDETELAQSFVTLRGGVGIRVRRVWETLYPPSDNGFTGAPEVFRRDLFGGDERRTHASNTVELCFNFGAGLRFAALGGHLGASAELAVEGRDPACLTPSLVVERNPSAEWPPIRSVRGEINAHFEAFVDVWITRYEKEWTWNLLGFTNSFATDPFLSLRPVTVATRRLAPGAAPPVVFQPGSTNLVDGSFAGGSFSVASGGGASGGGAALAGPGTGGAALVFTDVEPGTGRTRLMFARRADTGDWGAPGVVAVADGVLDTAVLALPSGGWLVAWSELEEAHLGQGFPPSRIRFVRSGNGVDWTAPGTVASLPDAVAEVRLVASGSRVLAVLRHTADGPRAVRHSISATEWDGTQWSAVTPVAVGVPLAGFRAVADPNGEVLMLVVEQGGSGGSHVWRNGVVGGREPFEGPVGRPFDLLSTGPGSYLVASGSDEGLVLHRLGPGTGWRRVGVPVPGAAASELALLELPGNASSPYVLAWVQGGSGTTIRWVTLDAAGVVVGGPAVAVRAASGAHSRLALLPDGARGFRLVVRHDGDSTRIQEFRVSTEAAPGDFVMLSRPRVLGGGGEFEVYLDGIAGRTYRLQLSTDLMVWTDLGGPVQPDAAVPVRVFVPAGAGRAFLRARSEGATP